MQRVQASILQLIGSLDPSLSQYIIPQDPDILAAAAVRWDTLQHLKFAVPFEQVKIDVFLGELTTMIIVKYYGLYSRVYWDVTSYFACGYFSPLMLVWLISPEPLNI